jgi:hypothetical protein
MVMSIQLWTNVKYEDHSPGWQNPISKITRAKRARGMAQSPEFKLQYHTINK